LRAFRKKNRVKGSVTIDPLELSEEAKEIALLFRVWHIGTEVGDEGQGEESKSGRSSSSSTSSATLASAPPPPLAPAQEDDDEELAALAALEALAAARLASLAACFVRFISKTTSSTDDRKHLHQVAVLSAEGSLDGDHGGGFAKRLVVVKVEQVEG
jgi:hypothetical protein